MSRSITVRRLDQTYDDVPLYWFDDNAHVTHYVHGLNLIFPAGERFFVRSVLAFSQVWADEPELAEQVRRFAGQEHQHGRAHAAANAVLERHGVDVRPWLERYEALAYERIEPAAPPALRLATTAALEHLTATLAEAALTDAHLERAHPRLRVLLRWHAVEEIEHRAVAYEVLQRVNPSWWLRAAGLAIGLACLIAFWQSAARFVIAQDPGATRARLRADLKRARAQGMNRRWLLSGLRDYLRPEFHPDQRRLDPLAAQWLASSDARDAGLGEPREATAS